MKECGTVTFKYDPFGRRIYKSSSSGISVFAYDGDNLVEETNAAGAVVARYSQGLNIDESLAMLRGASTSYYHADGLGSVTSLSNAAGALAQTYTYDSFGKLTASAGSLTNPFLYTARESDTETGLYYYRARYYDPSVGRFLSEDPTAFFEGPNFYGYVHNNPANLIDVEGMRAKRPDNLVSGTPKKYWKPFKKALAEALNRLSKQSCDQFFHLHAGCRSGPLGVGANRMRETNYRFLAADDDGPGVGAATMGPTDVRINPDGLFVTATTGTIRLPDGSTFNLGSALNVQAFILLHELGHQLKENTGFTRDVDDSARNTAHSVAVIKACFQKQ